MSYDTENVPETPSEHLWELSESVAHFGRYREMSTNAESRKYLQLASLLLGLASDAERREVLIPPHLRLDGEKEIAEMRAEMLRDIADKTNKLADELIR